MKFVPKSAQEKLAKHQTFTRKMVQKRLKAPKARPDFLGHLQKARDHLSDSEIEINAATMIFAGRHTLQTALTGIALRLIQHPEVLQRVTKEVRSAFPSKDQIDVKSLLDLPYLRAVVQEGTRLTSPVPLGLTRMVPKGGSVICGDALPAGVSVPLT